MADITKYQAIPIKDLLGDLSQYKNNPSLIQRKILDHLENITSGQIDIVDPTNPFVFLLEASCVNTALAIQENTIDLRKSYPALMQTIDDAYLHMSDQDYYDRFSTPAITDFTFYIELNSLLDNMKEVPGLNQDKVTIPRDTVVTVDGMTFMMQYPIDIIRYHSGVFQIAHDASIVSPMLNLTTNILEYTIKKDTNVVTWLMFKVPMVQVSVNSVEFPIQRSKAFIEDIMFNDSFYIGRVYYRNNFTNGWRELRTTHTDQVYDPYKPTAVFKVLGNHVETSIPPVYTVNEMISGLLRIDIFSTKGSIDINFSNYPVEQFQTTLTALDRDRDLHAYTTAFTRVTYFATTSETVVSGSNGYDFTTLREAILNNSIGDRQLPVTQSQIEYTVNTRGFDLHKHIDVITDRVFVLTKQLPRSVDRYPITRMSSTMATYIGTLHDLRLSDRVIPHLDRITIPSGTVFELIEGKLHLVDSNTLLWLSALPIQNYIEVINSRRFLVLPYHYVLDDTNDEFDMRAYSLDYPEMRSLNFKYQNPAFEAVVNTGKYNISKTTDGYRILLTTKSGTYYKNLTDAEVGVQLAYKTEGETLVGHIEGQYLGRNSDGERVYEFLLNSRFDIDSHDRIHINDISIISNPNVTFTTPLVQEINILYYTTNIPNNYRPSDADGLLGSYMHNVPSAVATHETISVGFGQALKALWRHVRSSVGGLDYARYDYDVPMFYEKDIYEIDQETGMIFKLADDCTFMTNKLHSKGDPVLDNNGDPIIKYRKGDVKLDRHGNPIPITSQNTTRYMDLLLLDYRSKVATRSDYKNYYEHIVKTIASWIVNDIDSIEDIVLEQTRMYYMPKKNIGKTLVMVSDNIRQHTDIQQSMRVKFFVRNAVYNDMSIRDSLNYRTIQILASHLAKQKVSASEMILAIKSEFSDTIESVDINGLGGELDLKLCYIEEDGVGLGLNKLIVKEPNGDLSLMEDVTFEYVDVEQD